MALHNFKLFFGFKNSSVFYDEFLLFSIFLKTLTRNYAVYYLRLGIARFRQ